MDTPPLPVQPRRIIRPYHPADRPALRAICADTGFLGQPIDPIFEDRELFADYLTAYYTDEEPESIFVCELAVEFGEDSIVHENRPVSRTVPKECYEAL